MPPRLDTSIAFLLLSAALPGTGCRRDPAGPADAEPDPKLEPCRAVEAVTVGDGLAPVFSWTPGCGMGGLTVFQAADTLPVWSALSIENQIASPVTYGVRPRGASASEPLRLQSGRTYRLVLGYTDPPPAGSVVVFVTVLHQQDFER